MSHAFVDEIRGRVGGCGISRETSVSRIHSLALSDKMLLAWNREPAQSANKCTHSSHGKKL